MDVQAATSSYDCTAPGCTGETYRPGGLCAIHAKEHARRAVAEAGRKKLPPVQACKDCGGPLDEKGRDTPSPRHRGRCGACRSASARLAAQAGKRSPAAAKPAKASANRTSTLVDAAHHLEQAAARLAAARADYQAAKERMEAALAQVTAGA